MSGDGHPDMNYEQHEKTYEGFLTFTRWSIILLTILLALMAVFLIEAPLAIVLIGGILLAFGTLYLL